jgi:flagellar P-ring protein precursor FlgI
MRTLFTLSGLALVVASGSLEATTRLKELVAVEGVRDNQLVGYGVVVGLNGTGDKRQTVFSAQSLANMLQRMGVTVPPAAILVRNTASVIVTANLAPFAQPGTKIDVTAAAIGDVSNLQGGLLVMTPLKGPDGKVYAMAQGSVVTGGFVAGRGGNAQTSNHPTVGRLPDGAIVEQAPPSVVPGPVLRLQVRHADFTTASRVVEAINKKFDSIQPSPANAENSGLITVRVPAQYAQKGVEFIAEIENLQVDSDRSKKVIINERTGTVVLGKDIRIAPTSILHGGLTVEIQTAYAVSQPEALSQGQTAVTPQTSVGVKETPAKDIALKDGASVEDLVRALTAIGSTARDVIAVLESLRAAGALDAEIEVL